MEWISVKDRVPKENIEVLIFDGVWMDCGRYCGPPRMLEEYWIVGGHRRENIIFWMPLPEKPKEN